MTGRSKSWWTARSREASTADRSAWTAAGVGAYSVTAAWAMPIAVSGSRSTFSSTRAATASAVRARASPSQRAEAPTNSAASPDSGAPAPACHARAAWSRSPVSR
ncbi:hypothetical protein GCM10020254_73050 [Streptomyces goshikiensis]